jgi:hypothetical protein
MFACSGNAGKQGEGESDQVLIGPAGVISGMTADENIDLMHLSLNNSARNTAKQQCICGN